MKGRFFLLTLGLSFVLLASACAPVVSPVEPPTPPSVPTVPPQPPTPTLAAATEIALPSEAPTQTPQPVATSRGPDLEATDPTTVRLDSGGLQLVEFFRFT